MNTGPETDLCECDPPPPQFTAAVRAAAQAARTVERALTRSLRADAAIVAVGIQLTYPEATCLRVVVDWGEGVLGGVTSVITAVRNGATWIDLQAREDLPYRDDLQFRLAEALERCQNHIRFQTGWEWSNNYGELLIELPGGVTNP